eukprot:1183974-Pyramimonas_sp.AAC.1
MPPSTPCAWPVWTTRPTVPATGAPRLTQPGASAAFLIFRSAGCGGQRPLSGAARRLARCCGN